MLALRTNSANPVTKLRNDMNRLFLEPFFRFPHNELMEAFEPGVIPPVNVWEDDQAVYAEAELPGWTMDDLEVSVLGNELTIAGERKTNGKEEVQFHRREHGMESFRRTLRFPVDVDADKVEATLHNGLLRLTLPKAASAKPCKIKVKAK